MLIEVRLNWWLRWCNYNGRDNILGPGLVLLRAAVLLGLPVILPGSVSMRSVVLPVVALTAFALLPSVIAALVMLALSTSLSMSLLTLLLRRTWLLLLVTSRFAFCFRFLWLLVFGMIPVIALTPVSMPVVLAIAAPLLIATLVSVVAILFRCFVLFLVVGLNCNRFPFKRRIKKWFLLVTHVDHFSILVQEMEFSYPK
jgi:hypothetical protein